MTGNSGMVPSRPEIPVFDVGMLGDQAVPVQCRNGKGYANFL